jgi:hypothetical protein
LEPFSTGRANLILFKAGVEDPKGIAAASWRLRISRQIIVTDSLKIHSVRIGAAILKKRCMHDMAKAAREPAVRTC